MTIQVAQSKSFGGHHRIELEVLKSGLTVTVKAGPFRYEGVDYELTEDSVFEVTNRPEKASIIGWLSIDTSDSDNVVVLVDEMLFDEQAGWDESFNWEGSVYQRINPIWNLARIPENTSTLDGVKMDVFHIIVPESE